MRRTASFAIVFALVTSVSAAAIANANSLPAALTGQTKQTTNTLASAKSKPGTDKDAKKNTKSDDTKDQPAPKTVTVQSGDTLIALADTNQTTYQRLFNANDSITDPNVINPGQEFRIPNNDEQLPDRISALPQVTQQTVAAAATAYSSTKRTATSYPAVSGNDAKAFIYGHESGNNPNATSPNGCYGLGQDCNGRVRAQCGADYACQDEYFTAYANGRYGGWDGAYAFWQANGWW